MQIPPSAAARRFISSNGDSRRSCFVARSVSLCHKRSQVSSACRVSLRPHAHTCAARLGFTTSQSLNIHMNARVYDPDIGRFLSPDPKVTHSHNPQGFNRYAYVMNNPLNLYDPDGFDLRSLDTKDNGYNGAAAPSNTQVDAGGNGTSGSGNASSSNAPNPAVQNTGSPGISKDVSQAVNAAHQLANRPQSQPVTTKEVISTLKGLNSLKSQFGAHLDQNAIRAAALDVITRGNVDGAIGPDIGAVMVEMGIASMAFSGATKAPGTRAPTAPLTTTGSRVAAPNPALDRALAARDALASQLAPLKGKAPATVTGGYNVKNGQATAAACGGGNCAETNVVNALDIDKDYVRFTPATRPRTGAEVPVCANCENTYGRGAFPPGTQFKSDIQK